MRICVFSIDALAGCEWGGDVEVVSALQVNNAA